MEFFVIFDGDKYLNLEANSIGTKCMGFGARRENRKPVKRVLPEGFPAIPEVGENEWTLTYELSMEDIKKFYPDVDFATFAAGYEFSGNFYKTGRQGYHRERALRHVERGHDGKSRLPSAAVLRVRL